MGKLVLDIDVEGRGFQSSNNTPSNGMYFKTGYQPDYPEYSNSVMMYISNKRRIGIKTQNPRADFHVDGTILAKSIITEGFGSEPSVQVVDNELFVQDGPDCGGTIPTSVYPGDIWIDTCADESGFPKIYTAAIGGASIIATGHWVLGESSGLISSDVNIFVQTEAPTATNIGDIWFDSDNFYFAYRAISLGTDGWEPADDLNAEFGDNFTTIVVTLTGAMADSEIIGYFNDEDPSKGFIRGRVGAHTNASFGDVWIDTSAHNKLPSGELKTNAINRWQNSTGGFINSSAVTVVEGELYGQGLAWRYAPSDATGQVYLETYLTRNIADRKSVTYYTNSYTTTTGAADGGGVYGPNVASTPTGQDNFNPQYDTWVDITPIGDEEGIPEFNPYIYLVNSSFDYTYSDSLAAANAWARHIYPGGGFDFDTSGTGWWNIRDTGILRVNSAFQTLNGYFTGLEGEFASLSGDFSSLEAQLDAGAFTIPFADKEVLLFIGDFTKDFGTAGNKRPDASSNNDVWIVTDYLLNPDGSANSNSIFVSTANTTAGAGHEHETDPLEYDEGGVTINHHWTQSPNNAVGGVFLDLYARGTLGEFDRGVNIMPRGYSMWDANPNEYKFDSFDETTPYQIQVRQDVLTPALGLVNTTFGAVSLGSLQLSSGGVAGEGDAEEAYATLANTGGSTTKAIIRKGPPAVTLRIPEGKKWIFSYYAYSNSTADVSVLPNHELVIYLDDTNNPTSNIVYFDNYHLADFTARNTWERFEYVIDLSNTHIHANASSYTDLSPRPWGVVGEKITYEATPPSDPLIAPTHARLSNLNSMTIRLDNNSFGGPGNTIWFDGLQLEEVGPYMTTASNFKEPGDHASLLFGRALTDGKIVVHSSPEFDEGDEAYPGGPTVYGPEPHLTPRDRRPNPEPHGDLWINTSNNDIIFRYHQNAINNTAQTAYYSYESNLTQASNSGWYSTQDERFGLFFANIVTLNAQIYDALANVDSLRTVADHDIITFFVPEDGSLFGNTQSNPSANFGDIWINTSDYNANLTHGGLAPNAVFRYQNGTSITTAPDLLWARSSPPVGSAGTLAWHHAPEDSFGKLYLSTTFNRNVADQKSVTYFEDGTTSGVPTSQYSGPNVAVTPLGVLNLNPKDDLWFDTGNGYVLHVYKANNTFADEYSGISLAVGNRYWDRTRRAGVWETDGTSPSGWYDVQDTRIGTIAADLAGNALSVGYALANSVDAKAIADHEIISHYAYEGGNFIAQSAPGSTGAGFTIPAGYGDIWINQSHWNTQGDGSLSANAILRFQNSSGGSMNTVGGVSTGATSNLSWNFAPNNAVGRVFLDAYLARNIADRKTVVFYAPNTGSPGAYFGPNPNTTPSGLNNPNPEGDLWIDTGGIPSSNKLYVYKTNGSFLIGQYVEPTLPMDAKAWSQTTYSGTIWDVGGSSPTGWYDAQDSEIADLRANVGNILNRVGIVESQGDREILAFFQDLGDATEIPDASGNNDVWIQTDYAVQIPSGAPNTAAIYISNSSASIALSGGEYWSDGGDVNTKRFFTDPGAVNGIHYWIPSPYNAIGLFYLEAYSAGIRGQFYRGPNIIPRGYSMWDANENDYLIYNNGGVGDTLDSVTPYQLFNYEGGLSVNTTFGAPDVPGTSSIEYTNIRSGTYNATLFANTNEYDSKQVYSNNYPGIISLPRGKRWVFSHYATSNSIDTPVSSLPDTRFYLYFSDIDDPGANVVQWAVGTSDFTTGLSNNTWQRFEYVVDLSNTSPSAVPSNTLDESVKGITTTSDLSTQLPSYHESRVANLNSMMIRLDVIGRTGNTIWVDGISMQEVANDISTAGPFREPGEHATIVFGRQITDGKVVAFYSPQIGDKGPVANVTPTGLPNPEPHGDFWINTSNLNMLFVYNQVGTNTSAHTANYSYYDTDEYDTITESGWYLSQDRQIGYSYANLVTQAQNVEHLFANVNFQRGLIDRDRVIFFEAHPGGVGDSEYSDGDFVRDGASAGSGAQFGDIWINIHPDNQHANGSLLANAIHRYANGSGGASTTPPHGDSLRWEFAPDDAIGKIYLETWYTRNTADRKTAIFYESNTFSGGRYYGPNVYFTQGAIVNPNPDGDLWIDTGGANRLYVYRTNTSFVVGSHPKDGGWAQTTHNSSATGAGGNFDPTRSDARGRGGWWDIQGFDSTEIEESILLNAWEAANALANAQFAQQLVANTQAIIDGEIISFYAPHDGGDFDPGEDHPTAKYGDIWIDTHPNNHLANGALDPAAIYRYSNSEGGSSTPSLTAPTNLGWYQAPNNAIGKVFLDSWKSQNTADSKVVTYIQAGTPLGTVPALYGPNPANTPSGAYNPNPENDLWIDTQDNYRIYRYQVIGSDVTTNTAYQTPNTTHSGWADVRDARIGDFPFSESRKAHLSMTEWAIEDVSHLEGGSSEELVLYDDSGNRNHARQSLSYSSNFTGDTNDFVATTIKGISTKALNRVNSSTMGWPPETSAAGKYYKDLALLDHDAIRNANQQSYAIWFKPSGLAQRHDWRIITRDQNEYWSLNIGGNTTHLYGGSETPHDYFFPSDGSYVNAIIKGSVESTPGAGAVGTDGRKRENILKYNTWNFIAFTLDYKGDNEVGNSVWYFANEDDGWENANVFYYSLDKDASANLSYSGDWGEDRGRGVGLQNNESPGAGADLAETGGGYAAPGHYAEFKYFDTYLSQSSIKKLYDFPFGVEDTSRNMLQTVRSQAIADGEIISFYAPESSPGGGFVRGETHPTANFGDIWIDTSESNANLTHGGLVVDAINRYQNTSFGPSQSEGILVWEAAPTNAVGKVFLDAALARNVADQKTVAYYIGNDAVGTTGYGPNVAVTPSDVLNPNPDRDLWIDTYGGNRLYIYLTNSEFSSVYVNPDSGTDKSAWAQTIHSGIFALDGSSFSGWWDVQDTELRDLIRVNEWSAANALADAANAQSSADHEILAFFEPEAAVGPDATGNGDIWIFTGYPVDLDGTPNIASIYIANTLGTGIPDHVSAPDHWWNPAPNNAIGRMYLESYSAGVSGQFAVGSNWWPRGYSTFDAPASDYSNNTFTIGEFAYPFRVADSTTPRLTDVDIVDDGESPIGGNNKVLRLKKAKAAAVLYKSSQTSGTYHSDPTVIIPKGKKWILSWYAKIDTVYPDTLNSGVFVIPANSSGLQGGKTTFASKEHPLDDGDSTYYLNTTDWERKWVNIDLRTEANTLWQHGDGTHRWYYAKGSGAGEVNMTANLQLISANTIDRLILRIDAGGWNDSTNENIVGNTVYYTGFQLEEVPADRSTPTDFKDPSDASAVVFGRQITDGKIVTHYSPDFDNGAYGPQPNTTPTGLPNPEPHGDFWINTSNGNMIFRYHQNDDNNSAQTANYAYFPVLSGDDYSGWYTGQDTQIIYNLSNTQQQWLDIANTLAQTAFAQSRIDNDIAAYFYPSGTSISGITFATDGVSGAAEFGDIWIDTGGTHMLANGTLGAAAIHRSQNGTSGGGGDLVDTLYWRQAAGNQLGRVYLETWATKNSVDRQTITVFSNSFGETAHGTHGPNTWFTPDGVLNPYPHGDFWLNTRNDGPDGASNNQLFIYLTNSTWSADQTESLINSSKKKAWAQTILSGVFTPGDSQTGWWDATDSRVNTALVIAEGAQSTLSTDVFGPGGLSAQTIWALQNTVFNRTEADNDRVILYYSYGASSPSPSYNFQTSISSSGAPDFPDAQASFGDIWINTSGLNQNADGSLHTNAIHRAQNSTSGAAGSLGWYRTPTNQLGLVYLDAFLTRNVADRKVAIFVSRGFTAGDDAPTRFDGTGDLVTTLGYFGPNVAYTDIDDQEIFNPNPDGDLWYDTTIPTGTSSPRNVLYVYKTNAAFHIGENIHDYTNQGVWAQTVHRDTVFDSTKPTGWYDVTDTRLSSAGIAADREIISFFQTSRAGQPTGSGNGDIWIVTDWVNGGANTGAIYRFDTRVGPGWTGPTVFGGVSGTTNQWVLAEENALGLMYLSSYAAGTTLGLNILPAPYSDFSAPKDDYAFSSVSAGDVVSGTGVPYPIWNKNITRLVMNLNSDVGFTTRGASIEATMTPTNLAWPTEEFSFSNNQLSSDATSRVTDWTAPNSPPGSPFIVNIPKGKRWIFSYYARSNNYLKAHTRCDLRIKDSTQPTSNTFFIHDGNPFNSGSSGGFSANNEWNRRWVIFDLSNTTHIMYGNKDDEGDQQARVVQSYNQGVSYPADGNFTFNPNSISFKEFPKNDSPNSTGAAGAHTYPANVDQIMIGFTLSNTSSYWFEAGGDPASHGIGSSSDPADGQALDSPVSVFYDGLQLEEVALDVYEPTPFKEPSGSFGASFGRVIADGKVVAHFADGIEDDTGAGIYLSDRLGPPPNTTPAGLPNPDPNGDMWIDTANGHAVYQYYANSVYGTGLPGDIADTIDSQRVFYVRPPLAGERDNVYVGWISTQDTGIAAANLAAYEGIARGEWAQTNLSTVFTVPYPPDDIPTAYKANDIWFNTSDPNDFLDGAGVPTHAGHYSNALTYGMNRQYRAFAAEVDHIGPEGWIEARDNATLFSLAGDDPFDLNPFFAKWGNRVGTVADGAPDGWVFSQHLGTGEIVANNTIYQSGDADNRLSVQITGGGESRYIYRTIRFPTPLFANSFITGAYVGMVGSGDGQGYNTGVGGLVITVEHQPAGGGTVRTDDFQASLGNNFSGGSSSWEVVPFRATTDQVFGGPGGSREITAVTFHLGVFANSSEHTGGSGEDMKQGATTVNFDQIYFDILHPFLRLDANGSIKGTYLEDATITTAKIGDLQVTNELLAADIDASKITTGTLQVGTTVSIGGHFNSAIGVQAAAETAKIVIDGVNGRIIIRDSN